MFLLGRDDELMSASGSELGHAEGAAIRTRYLLAG